MDDAKLTKVVALLQQKVNDMDASGDTVRFDFNDGTAVLVDCNSAPPTVAADTESDADCTISANEDTFQEMLDGDLDPTAAFMTGKIKIDGSMSAAMAIAKVLG